MTQGNNEEFGQLVESILNFTGQKNYVLAKHLGYDISYISKWINGNKLPTIKNIRKINKNIAEFLIKSVSDSQLDELISKFEIEIKSPDEKKDAIKKYVENKLSDSYVKSLDNKKTMKYENVNKNCIDEKIVNSNVNSNISINPQFKKKDLTSVFNELYSKQEKIESIILSNLFSINRDDIIFLSGIKDNVFDLQYRDLYKTSLLMHIDENQENDLVFNAILLINMATLQKRINFEFYSCNFPSHSSLAVIKDTFMHNALYNSSKKCIMTSTSIDKKVVTETYEMLNDMKLNQSSKIFEKYTPEEIISRNTLQHYLISNNIKMLLGDITELFMPNELYMSVGNEKLQHIEHINLKLKEVKNLIENVTYNLNNEILIYESSIEKYVITGKMSYFNTEVEIPLKDRFAHLTYLKEVIEQKTNMKIGIIKEDFIEGFKDFDNPSLYLSNTVCFLKEKNNSQNNYLIFKDKTIQNFFHKFYQEISENKNSSILYDRDEILFILNKNLLHLNALITAHA